MRKVTVNTKSKYNVIIGSGIAEDMGRLIVNCSDVRPCKLCLVSDDTVYRLFGRSVTAALESEGFSVDTFVFSHGESSKNTDTLIRLLNFMAEKGLSSSDAVLSLGGGVVGDLSGLGAALYLRGIRIIHIPTTLLAAVDSSVGGKTAVDLMCGKNLVGTFHQPTAVICDTELLRTLPEKTFSEGLAEVIKYGVISDRRLFERIKSAPLSLSFDNAEMEDIISNCVNIKAVIASEDEFDKGKRKLLNFGHTVGHAIELLSDFKISHGDAVAVGMTVMTRSAVKMGICKASVLSELISALDANGLPWECKYTPEELSATALHDKKRQGNSISLVLPHDIGDCRIIETDVNDLCGIIKRGI